MKTRYQNANAVHQSHLYLQVQETLKEMIEGVEYEPGDRIPSERELAESLGVSRMTVRRAVESLINAGLLERRSTSGTFVRQPQVLRHLAPSPIQSLTRQIRGKGGQVGSKTLLFKKIRAPKKVAEFLHLRIGSYVIYIRRLRLTNNIPFCIENSYLPHELFPGLNEGDLERNTSLYQIFNEKYQVVAMRSIDTLSISFATEEEAKYLELNPKDPVLFFRSVIFNTEDIPFEYLKSINHPRRVAFRGMTTIA